MKILFVGAGGAGMGGLVRWHLELKNEVYLEDDGMSPAGLLGRYPEGRIFSIDTTIAFDRAVFSDAIAPDHPVRAFARENKIPVWSYAEELGALSKDRHVIAIAGTHGKSTTTALISWALTAAGQDPLCVIGAEIKAWNGGFRFGKGPVVVEADEFRKHFLHLEPTVIVITSLEADHFDTYATEDELVETFVAFCMKKSVESVFIARGTLALDRLSEELAKRGQSHLRFGGTDDLIFCSNLDIQHGRSRATIVINGKEQLLEIQSVTCPHVMNLLSATTVLVHEVVPSNTLKEATASFPGILRRLEPLGTIERAPLYSDYAHHPTAVRETLQVLKRIFPDARIGVVFEPHERLRTSTLQKEYETAFQTADAIGLLPVYDPIGRQRPDIADSATKLSPTGNVTQLTSYDGAFAWVTQFAKQHPGNGILVIMGAGPIDGAFRKFNLKM